jgi:prophage maintenance system killer protein
MERENWIQNVLNSTNGMTTVTPNADLLSRIQQKIKQQEKVSPKTVWLIAASIAVLVTINFALLSNKAKENTATVYLENTLNKSNQLYQ